MIHSAAPTILASGREDPGTSALDGALTAEREETKFQIRSARVQRFVHSLLKHVKPHRFVGKGANRLPDAQHYSTTIYLDTPSHSLLRAAAQDAGNNLKIRAREYYDLHSSLAELATDPAQIVHYQPFVWFELKRRLGDKTFKHRLRLAKDDVASFFRGKLTPPLKTDDEARDLAAIRDVLAGLGEPLSASVLVNYRRLAFQDPEGALRVTLDLDLSFYAAPTDLWTRKLALVRGTFGTPARIEPGVLLEIKLRGPQPAWLSQALLEAEATPEHRGKFVRAGRVVHGAP